MTTRKERGRETESLVAWWFRERGWPYAEPVGAGRPGADITGMPGLACEVKATAGWSPLAWLRQAKDRGGLPFVVARMNGQGSATIGSWPVVVPLDVFTGLLQAAGYTGKLTPVQAAGELIRLSEELGLYEREQQGEET